MKLGVITDIHAHVYHLLAALERLQAARVDQVIVVGDVSDLFHRREGLEETCRLLAGANAIGVWGNHDYGLCVNPDPGVTDRFPSSVIAFMGSLRPRLEVDGCLFTHVEPWLDPEYMPDLWYSGGPPSSRDRLARIFSSAPNRLIFVGHYHKWLLATPDGIIEWNGTTSMLLDEGRYFVAVGALCDGNFAIFDTVSTELTPLITI
jgi:hypothetical protein